MLDKGGEDLQPLWNICTNSYKPNDVLTPTSRQQKLLIVKAVQKLGGVGVAMGITSTELPKEAADMILTDNFASIAHAVRSMD